MRTLMTKGKIKKKKKAADFVVPSVSSGERINSNQSRDSPRGEKLVFFMNVFCLLVIVALVLPKPLLSHRI